MRLLSQSLFCDIRLVQCAAGDRRIVGFSIREVDSNRRANVAARVYVDPDGEKVDGGLIVAKKISSALAHRKYG